MVLFMRQLDNFNYPAMLAARFSWVNCRLASQRHTCRSSIFVTVKN